MIFLSVNMTLDAFAEQEACAFLQNHFHGDFWLNFPESPQQFVQILLVENKLSGVLWLSQSQILVQPLCVCIFWTFSMDLKVLNAF